MSLEQGIKHGKEHRKEYRGSEYIDPSCRPHGGCDWCYGNRMYRAKKEKEKLDVSEFEYRYGDEDS